MNSPGGIRTEPARQRREDLDTAKGLGILLVVLGHLAARSQPADNAWYAILQTAIYQFHMPFFMYLSGYVTVLSGAAFTPLNRWIVLLRKRTERLLFPFVLFGLALIAGKLIASRFIHVDNLPTSLGTGIVDLIWDTDRSPALSVWYIAVLFALCMLAPLALWAARGRPLLLLPVILILYFIPVPHVMYLDRIARYGLFFAAGGFAYAGGDLWLVAIQRFRWMFMCALVLMVALVVVYFDSFNESVRILLCGLAAAPALHGLTLSFPVGRPAWLLAVGRYSFIIYLLNTPFIGATKGVLLRFAPWDGTNFLYFAPAMLLAGVLGPLLVKRLLFRHVAALDRLTD